MRLTYLVVDRPDIAFAVKDAARKMKEPTEGDLRRVKRIVRYLIGTPEARTIQRRQTTPPRIVVSTDSDWAGCGETKNSTSGGCIDFGTHMITA